ncbi:MAG: hypothetical protein Q8P27_02765, partial [Candidatus Peregrinibacteria bacterium]|nr:hypothetical protein [Candidatus Peregrinibacteria bacterium]
MKFKHLLKLPSFFTGLFLLPGLTNAHVKWFTEESEAITETVTESINFSLAEPVVMLWIAIVIGLVCIAGLLDQKLPKPPQEFVKKVKNWKIPIIRIFEIMVGVSLLTAASRGIILVPHYESTDTTLILRIAEELVGLLLILNRLIPIAVGLLILIYAGSIFSFGFF